MQPEAAFAPRPAGRRDRSFYNQLTWTICLAVCLPIVAAGCVYAYISLSNARATLLRESVVSLSTATTAVERVLGSSERAALRLASSRLVRDSFSIPDFNRDYFYHVRMLEAMQTELDQSDATEEIFYSNAVTGLVLSTRYGYKLAADFYLPQDLVAARQGDRPARWARLPDTSESLSFVRQLPDLSLGPPRGALVVRLLTPRLRELAEAARQGARARALLVFDSQGLLTAAGLGARGVEEVEHDPGIQRILESSANGGSFVGRDGRAGARAGAWRSGGGRIEGAVHAYAWFRPTLGRTYVTLIPRGEVATRALWIAGAIAFSVALIAGAGLLLSIAGSRRIYSPIFELARLSTRLAGPGAAQGNEVVAIRECIAHLNEEIETLRGFLHEKIPTLRRQLLRELVCGEGPAPHEAARDASEYGVPTGCRYAVLAVNAEGLRDEAAGSAASEATDALPEILDQWLSAPGREPAAPRGAAVKGRFSPAVVIAFLDDPGGGGEGAVQGLARGISAYLREEAGLQACVGVGRPVPELAAIAASHREAVVALQHCSFRGARELAFAEVEADAGGPFLYPRDIEREVVEALADQDREHAEAALQRFGSTVLGARNLSFIRQAYDVLLSSIVFSFQDQGGNILELMGHDLYEQLHARSSPRAKQAWLARSLFPLFVSRLALVQRARRKAALARVRGFIRENIGADVSLVRCADVVDMSPSYISRLFKAELGVSFIEYVLKCKVDEVKHRLRETDSPIGDIAASIGYSERSLYRIFQRVAGMNPNAYRKGYR